MRSENKRGNGKRGGWLNYLTLSGLLSISIGLSACSSPDKENLPGNQASPTQTQYQGPPRQMVKPKDLGVRLTPKSATSSKSEPGSDPGLVIDGNPVTKWNGGAPPPQWVLIDLGEPTTISRMLFNVSQFPAGPTTHQIYGGSTPDDLKPLGTLDSDTTNNQWLDLPLSAKDIRYLKVTTVKSPSWVSWNEIEVYK